MHCPSLIPLNPRLLSNPCRGCCKTRSQIAKWRAGPEKSRRVELDFELLAYLQEPLHYFEFRQ
jgi:hypothetical protein